MQELAGAVDGYSLMTYDYSAAAPGPNFPLPWQEQNVKQFVSKAGGKGSTGWVLGMLFVLLVAGCLVGGGSAKMPGRVALLKSAHLHVPFSSQRS